MQAHKKMVRQGVHPERSQRTEYKSQKIKGLCFLFSVFCSLVLLGCSSPQSQVRSSTSSQMDQVYSPQFLEQKQKVLAEKRFQQTIEHGQTAVESAIELSQKYAKLSEQAAVLQSQNQDLVAENSRLKEQVAELDTKLKQAQKELTEANDLLIEMRIELNNWKTDVLAFRHELREADIAQLEALLKILKILGAEVAGPGALQAAPEPDQAEKGAVITTLSERKAQAKSQETSNQGGPNE